MFSGFHHRIETPLPFQAKQGAAELSGWCVSVKTSAPPDVKLIWKHGEFRARQVSRPDVGTALGVASEGEAWGFVFGLELPSGPHLLTLLAGNAGEDAWHRLEDFTVLIFSPGLQAQIEYPPENPITESVRIQGWCFHPEKSLRSVALHYGTRRVSCESGLPRADLAGFAPGTPVAAHSGFITTKNIGTGRGDLRVVATDTEGTRHFFRTDRRVDVDRDEESPDGLGLPLLLAHLSTDRHKDPSTDAADAPRIDRVPRKRILFALYGDFTSNSAIHVTALANAMVEAGCECVVAVPEHAETISLHRPARFTALPFAAMPGHGLVFTGGRGPDVVHAWTTRESVRVFCARWRGIPEVKLVVHLEDNEQQILETNTGRTAESFLRMPDDEIDRLVGNSFSHPRRAPEFLGAADGISVLVGKLRELAPCDRPVHEFWPAADAKSFFPRTIPSDFRNALGLGRDHTVLLYHGNVHAANRAEVGELYAAVAKLNEQGQPTTLLRCGRDTVDFPADRRHVISLGQIRNHHHLGPLLALADFFVQPGQPDAFNDYRFPSKLPEFFALGRPVILPRTNLGRVVRHLVDAYVLEKADAAGIAEAIRLLVHDEKLRIQLSAGAVAFAATHFSWERAAAGLLEFYDGLPPRV